MCKKLNENERFIRRREAAILFMQDLLDQQQLSGQQALGATTDKFSLNPCIRDDYRIFKSLWALLD